MPQKIALYNSAGGHNEVMGYLIEMFKDHSIKIFYNNDKFGYISYFKTIFECIDTQVIPIDNFKNNYETFDKIFIITMTNNLPQYILNVQHKTYGIIHTASRRSPYIINYITLFPNQLNYFKKCIKDDTKQYYSTFPFYNVPTNNSFSNKKYILQIGSLWDNDEDLHVFEKSINYEIVYFTKGQKKINRNMNTISKYLQNSAFILGRKTWNYAHAFTGSLALAFSFNVPIILPKFKQKEYNIPCITFDETYCELIDFVNTFNVDEYNKLKTQMNDFKEQEIKNNTAFLCN